MCPDFPVPPGGGATAAQVWAYATRQLSADGANVIRDAVLSDANKIPGANINASISSRAPSGEYDTELDAAVSTRAAATNYTASRAAKIDKIQDFLEEASGTLTATGAEDTVKEILTTVNKLHCLLDLTAMVASDSVTIRQYMTIKSAGSPIKYAEETYTDVQSLPMLYIVTKPARYGIKITLEQTAGTYRDYDWETFQEKAA